MGLCLQVCVYVLIFRGFLSAADEISWFPCTFNDEEVTYKENVRFSKPIPDTKFFPRPAVLLFGLKQDPLLSNGKITFIITPSKLDVRRSLDEAEVGELTCELQRYSTDGTHVRWPVRGKHKYNRWFTLNISHSRNLFNIQAFLRQSTDQPPTGQHDYKSWTVIKDSDVITTTVVMFLQTQTPLVKSPLKSQPELHCQFNIDHKAAKVNVTWHKLHDRTFLFHRNSRTGLIEGSGVSLKQLETGDATYTIPVTKVGSEGIYFCYVNVHPLLGKLRMDLQIEEPPRVSLNVKPTLILSEDAPEDALKKVVCYADGYYPLDVDIQWSHHDSTDMGPRVHSVLLSSHAHNSDSTLSLSAFFYIKPKLKDSGRKFTCSVSHQSLSAPIKRTFTLIVTEPGRWILVFNVVCLFVVLVLMMRFCFRVRRGRFF